jgi:hypothetical protein
MRLLDITQEIRDCHFPEGDDMKFPAPYALVVLIVKVRLICIHDILVLKAEAFLGTELDLPQDVKTAIVSFLTGGDEATALNEELLRQANELMDYIDEPYPAILEGALDTSMLPAPAPGRDGVDDDQAFDVRGFMRTFADGLPVNLAFRNMLHERYGYEV